MKYFIYVILIFSVLAQAQTNAVPTYPNRFSCINNDTGLEVPCESFDDENELLRKQRALQYKPWDTAFVEDEKEPSIYVTEYDHLFVPGPLKSLDGVSLKNKGIPDQIIKYIDKFVQKTKNNIAFKHDAEYERPPASLVIAAYVYTKENFDFDVFESTLGKNNQYVLFHSEFLFTISENESYLVHDNLIDHHILSKIINNSNIVYIQPYLFGAVKPMRKTEL